MGLKANSSTVVALRFAQSFTYFGVQSLLVLYLTGTFSFSQPKSYQIVGAYLALSSVTPLIGGMLIDRRWLTYDRSLRLGFLFTAAGALLLVVEHTLFLYLGMASIICGTGLLVTNLANILAGLNERSRRQGNGKEISFTIFYAGINLAAMVAVFICGAASSVYGLGLSFLIAAAVGLVSWGSTLAVDSVDEALDRSPSVESSTYTVLAVSLLSLSAVSILLWLGQIISFIIGGFLVFVVVKLLRDLVASRDRTGELICFVVFLLTIVIFTCLQQDAASLTLFTQAAVERRMMGVEIPAVMFKSFNPMAIILIAPAISFFWSFLRRRNIECSHILRFGIGIVFIGLGFITLGLGIKWSMAQGAMPVSMSWLVASYLLQAFGEVCAIPSAMALVSELAPKDKQGFFMGTWFVGISIGGYLSGQVAKAAIADHAATGAMMITSYANLYQWLGTMALALGVVYFLVTGKLSNRRRESYRPDVSLPQVVEAGTNQ